jgi:hypothetical protein
MPKLPPEEWKSAGEPMTEAQASYLKRLSQSAGEQFDPTLSKAQASRRIDELRSKGGGPSTEEVKAPAPRGGRRRPPNAAPAATGYDDRMTDAQATYLRELLESEAGEELDPNLSREAASQRIAELLVKHMEHSPSAASHR